VTTLEPATIEELSDAVRSSTSLSIQGLNSSSHFRIPGTSTQLLTTKQLTGIISFEPDDQVVEVQAGTILGSLQDELMQKGQCLPIVGWADGFSPSAFFHSTVGGEISLNLPHFLEAETRSWRDWIIGMTVVLADGTIAKSGSHAVKSVAGYDLHRFMVGTRGTLAVIAKVILRTVPLRSLPEPKVVYHDEDMRIHSEPTGWIQRVQASDFHQASEASRTYNGFDVPNSSTLWRTLPEGEQLPRYPGDWVIRSGCGEKNLQITDPDQVKLMKKAKEVFDLTGKLNPGEMGIF
jgi:hypothetical protein